MRSVDERMASCPLKHQIRISLWQRFAALVGRPIRSYLTLYSPPMMDIKLFHSAGLVQLEGHEYKGVVAVTYDGDAFAEALSQSEGRPELLVSGDINNLLAGSGARSPNGMRLRNKFPYDVINLDYTNSLFWKANKEPISAHLSAIDEIVRLQAHKQARKFALFVTTRAEPGQLAAQLLDDLVARIDGNLSQSAGFTRSFHLVHGNLSARDFLQTRYESFISLGLVKMLANVLSSNRFETSDCEAIWLIRDAGSPLQALLHLAILARAAQPRAARTIRELGRTTFYERQITTYVSRHRGESRITESGDGERLRQLLGTQIAELAAATFEIKIPEPEKRDETHQ